MATRTSVTQLLDQWRGGKQEARDRLIPLLYDELRRVASRAMRGQRSDHTLRPTALVHDAYLKMVDDEVPWKDRAHFLAVAAQAMRHILVDHAKARLRAKRGGGAVRVPLEDADMRTPETPLEVIALDDALKRLARQDPRKARIVELHFFGGLTYVETAEAMRISEVTVHRDLKLAKAWLHRELKGREKRGDESLAED